MPCVIIRSSTNREGLPLRFTDVQGWLVRLTRQPVDPGWPRGPCGNPKAHGSIEPRQTPDCRDGRCADQMGHPSAPRISRKSGGVQDPDRRFNPNSVLHQTRATPLTDRPHGLVLITRTLPMYPWLSLTKSKKNRRILSGDRGNPRQARQNRRATRLLVANGCRSGNSKPAKTRGCLGFSAGFSLPRNGAVDVLETKPSFNQTTRFVSYLRQDYRTQVSQSGPISENSPNFCRLTDGLG